MISTHIRILLSTVLFTVLAPALSQYAASAESSGKGPTSLATIPVPRIQFASPVFDFGKVDAGQTVKHDFVFTNIGNATLEVTEVRTSCGCTTTGKWDRQVAAGKTGAIPIELNTTGYRGGVVKTINVLCNDTALTNVLLQLKGTIWTPVDVLPSLAVFTVSSESSTNETKMLRVINNMEEPLSIAEVICTNRALKAELKAVRPDKEYQMMITAIPPFSSSPLKSQITLKTTSKRLPLITIQAYVMAQPLVVATPNEIMLPVGPLAGELKSSVMIRNSSTNAVFLSEPSMNITNATVQLQELQPGRLFNLLVNFPAGFQLPADQHAELSVKTTHSNSPVIKVPVRQTPQPAQASPSGTPPNTNLNSIHD
ncbi:MAG: DUF1573 domain-containing protein [Chloroflexota bacterium]